MIQDSCGNTMACTLWDGFADKAYELLGNKDDESIDILIIQFCKATVYQGTIRLTNSFHASKLLVNTDCDEVEEFRNSLHIETGRSETISSDETLTTPKTKKEIQCSIKELVGQKQEGFYWITGVVTNIETSEWHYIGCKRCPKKLIMREDKSFYCTNCGISDETGVMRYKIIMDVADDSRSSPFIVWNNQCKEIIGKEAGEIKALNSEGDSLPYEIEEAFLHKTFKCKIEIKKGESWKLNTIISIVEDESISSSLLDYSIGLLESANRESESNNTNNSLEDINKQIQCNITDETMEGFEETNSGTTNEVLDDHSDLVAMKRKLEDEFSATKPKRSTRIKKEKKTDE